MPLTPEQRNVIARSLRVARRRGASPRVQKALLEAESVESNFRHLPYGDRDSVGVLQQRPSQGWGPASESVEQDVNQFLDRAMRLNGSFKGSAGALAQQVQRSAFPGRYDQRSAEANALLNRRGAARGPAGGAGGTVTSTNTVGGVDNSQARRALFANFLLDDSKSKDILDLAVQAKGLADVPGQKVTTTSSSSRGIQAGPQPTTDDIDQIVKRANAIDKRKLPYQWGGGHQAGGGGPAQPLDCSGAVSKALGVNPRVAGQFTSWGKPGKGKGRDGVRELAPRAARDQRSLLGHERQQSGWRRRLDSTQPDQPAVPQGLHRPPPHRDVTPSSVTVSRSRRYGPFGPVTRDHHDTE
jgi:hypothetical protein